MKKPYFWKARKAWYINQPNGGALRLATTKKEAFDTWHKLVARREKEAAGDPILNSLIERYYDYALQQFRDRGIKPKSLKGYSDYIEDFRVIHGEKRVSQLKPMHVTDWLADRPTWGQVRSGPRSRESNAY